jgi:hypothetical protein
MRQGEKGEKAEFTGYILFAHWRKYCWLCELHNENYEIVDRRDVIN